MQRMQAAFGPNTAIWNLHGLTLQALRFPLALHDVLPVLGRALIALVGRHCYNVTDSLGNVFCQTNPADRSVEGCTLLFGLL